MVFKFFFRILFWITLFVISIASIVPQFFPQNVKIIQNFSFRLDYVLHFISYFFLAAFFTIWRYSNPIKLILIILVLFFGFIVSSIFEMIQYFLPNRTFNPYDMLSNFSGFIFGFIASIILVSHFVNKNRLIKKT